VVLLPVQISWSVDYIDLDTKRAALLQMWVSLPESMIKLSRSRGVDYLFIAATAGRVTAAFCAKTEWND